MQAAVIADVSAKLETARAALRRATAAHHERVDRLFSRADLSTGAGYGRFLTAQARAHLPVERALTRAQAARVVDDWPARRREDRLYADLSALGLAVPDDDVAIAFDGPEAVLGGVYVLEGSRLGGAVLRRRLPPALPCAFLSATDPVGWRRLLAILEARLLTPAQRGAAIAAAAETFAVFERAAGSL